MQLWVIAKKHDTTKLNMSAESAAVICSFFTRKTVLWGLQLYNTYYNYGCNFNLYLQSLSSLRSDLFFKVNEGRWEILTTLMTHDEDVRVGVAVIQGLVVQD